MRETPVLVCGGGLVGLSIAALLARHGVPPLLVERHADTSLLPKGRGVNVRSMEVFRSIGLESALAAAPLSVLSDYTEVVRARDLCAPEEARSKRPAPAGLVGLSPSQPLMVDQNVVEPVIRAHAASLGADLRYGVELVSFQQEESAVIATIREVTTGAEELVRAQYLVAADGHRSPVRHRLGIEVDQVDESQHFVNIPFQADLSGPLAGRRIALAYLGRPAPDTMLTRLDRDDRWVLMVPFDGAEFDPSHCAEAVTAAVGRDVGFSLLDLSVQTWELASWVAQRYRCGRVFLAGDSAHVMAPAGGLGGNTGIQDAHNLAWKLALVLRGRAGESLLDSYEQERRPVALVTRDYCAQRQRSRTSGGGDQSLAIDPISISLGYHQFSDAVVGSGRSGAITPVAALHGAPGTRLPHAPLGDSLSTVDLCADGFALVAGPGAAKWVLAARSLAASTGLPLIAGSLDSDWPSDSAAALLGLGAGQALLVRPDGYVCWRSTGGEDPVATLDQVLSTVLAQ